MSAYNPWLTKGDCPPGTVRRLDLKIFHIEANYEVVDALLSSPLSGTLIEKQHVTEEHLDITSFGDSQSVILNRQDLYVTITVLYPIDPFVYALLEPIEKISAVLQEDVSWPTEQVEATYKNAGTKWKTAWANAAGIPHDTDEFGNKASPWWYPSKKLADIDETGVDYATNTVNSEKPPHKFLYTVTHYSIQTEKLANFIAVAGRPPYLGYVVTSAEEHTTCIKVLAEGTISIAQYASYLYATDMLYRGRDEDTSSLLSRFYGERALTFRKPEPEPVVLEAKPRRIKLR